MYKDAENVFKYDLQGSYRAAQPNYVLPSGHALQLLKICPITNLPHTLFKYQYCQQNLAFH